MYFFHCSANIVKLDACVTLESIHTEKSKALKMSIKEELERKTVFHFEPRAYSF